MFIAQIAGTSYQALNVAVYCAVLFFLLVSSHDQSVLWRPEITSFFYSQIVYITIVYPLRYLRCSSHNRMGFIHVECG